MLRRTDHLHHLPHLSPHCITFRFLVDSQLTFDTDLPALKNEQGNYCNMIKVKAPSYSAPQWNKVPREDGAATAAAAKMGRSAASRSLGKKQPLKSASSSKIGAAAGGAGKRRETPGRLFNRIFSA